MDRCPCGRACVPGARCGCGRYCGASLGNCGCQGSSLMGLGEAPAQGGGFPFVLTALLGGGLVIGVVAALAR